jgi:hypothetical protein
MPWFHFDLVVNGEPRDQGGMILEDIAGAQEQADMLARALCIAKPELEAIACYVRVTDEEQQEIYQTPVPHAAPHLK